LENKERKRKENREKKYPKTEKRNIE